ncbi:MAG: transketolase family protein [Syntrophobacteraceae bacterium]
MDIRTKTHAGNLVSWAKNRPQIIVLSADLTASTEIAEFQVAYPNRFFSMGVAEQNMISFAAGMAREGYIPLVHTFAVFIYRQALNQIISSVAYPFLPVKMFGFLPGIISPGGATHQATDDIAILRAVPNITIFEMGDATEVESVMDSVLETPGPVYVRMLRGEIPRLFPKEEPFRSGIPRLLSRGTDITLISAGICTEEAMRATQALTSRGVSIHHVHVSTHKPFTSRVLLDAVSRPRFGVITMENHTIVGGLGTEVAELIAQNGVGKRLSCIGLQDTFAHGGSKLYLMKKYCIDAMALVRKVEEHIGRDLGVSETDLAAVRIESVHSLAKEEAL